MHACGHRSSLMATLLVVGIAASQYGQLFVGRSVSGAALTWSIPLA
jgi:hypothetical protein